MSEQPPVTELHFAACRLRPDSRSLLRDGEPVEVQGQVFDLLAYLARNPGRVISKDELLSEVWSHPYQTDSAIAQAVRKARKAVGDDGRRQAIIRTIQGQGVQLVAPVSVLDPRPDLPAHRTGHAPRRGRPLAAIAALVLLGLAILAMIRVSAPGPNAVAVSLGISPFDVTSETEEQWLSVGLPEMVARALEGQPGWTVRGTSSMAEIPDAPAGVRAALAGVDSVLEAEIERNDSDLVLRWKLTPAAADGEVQEGEIRSMDASRLARELVDAVRATQAGEPPVFIPHRELLDDPLAAELYARGLQALHRQKKDEAIALLEAARTRLPDSGLLQAALAKARFDPTAFEDSVQRYQQVLEQTPDTEPRGRAWLLYEIGTERWFQGEVDEAALFLEQALTFSDKADESFLEAQIVNSLSFVRQSQNRFDDAWALALRAERQFRELQSPFHLGQALTNLGYLAEDFGRLLEARRYHEEALALRERFGVSELTAASHYGIARVDRKLGRFDDAARRVERNLANVARLQRPFDVFDNLEELAEIRMRQGRYDDALRLLDRAETIATEQDDAIGLAWVAQVRARASLRRSIAPAHAFAETGLAIRTFHDLGEDYQRFEARVELARLYQLAARADVSRILLSALTGNPAVENPVLKLTLESALAEQAMLEGNHEVALERFEAIVRESRRLGAADLEAETALRLGRLCIENDRLDLASQMLIIGQRWSPDYYRTRALADAIVASRRLHAVAEDHLRVSE